MLPYNTPLINLKEPFFKDNVFLQSVSLLRLSESEYNTNYNGHFCNIDVSPAVF